MFSDYVAILCIKWRRYYQWYCVLVYSLRLQGYYRHFTCNQRVSWFSRWNISISFLFNFFGFLYFPFHSIFPLIVSTISNSYLLPLFLKFNIIIIKVWHNLSSLTSSHGRSTMWRTYCSIVSTAFTPSPSLCFVRVLYSLSTFVYVPCSYIILLFNHFINFSKCW